MSFLFEDSISNQNRICLPFRVFICLIDGSDKLAINSKQDSTSSSSSCSSSFSSSASIDRS